jgi:hypothetical protein
LGIKLVEKFIYNTPEMKSFSRVLSWVLKTHSEAIVSLTSEIAPFFETGFGINEKKGEVSFPTSTSNEYFPATLGNLLLRTPCFGFPYEYLIQLDRVKKAAKVSVNEMKKIKEKTVDLIKAYASTKEALEAIKTVSRPIDSGHFDLAVLRKQEEVTNVKKLRKFEKNAKEYLDKIKKQDWSRFPQIDPSVWKEKAKKHKMDVGNREHDRELYQYPILGWSPLNIYTDIERMLIPFFIVQERVDASYLKCRSLFQKCKDSSGFLRGPPAELKNETIKTLEEFNINYGGLKYPELYAGNILRRINDDSRYGIQKIRSHKISLKDIDKLLAKPLPDKSVKNASEILKQIHYLVSWERNIVHPY